MIVGIPKEIKDNERRVALTPEGSARLVAAGQRVLVERGAGAGSGFPDADYSAAGAELVDDVEELWARAELIVKVKEPVGPELGRLRADLVLFTYLHLAASPAAARALLDSGATGIAYETVQTPDGRLPLLEPMSEVAGRLAAQAGAHYLEAPHGGAGKLLGGVGGAPPARVVVLGAGAVGRNACEVALGMGAEVTLLNRGAARRERVAAALGSERLSTDGLDPQVLEGAVREADLLVGAIYVPGAAAPKIVSRALVESMRPGSVIVDVAVDQGGCVETTRPTTHSDPVFVVAGVVHYCVANMPGAVPRTSTLALTAATLPYVLALATLGPMEAARADPALAKGFNTHEGRVVHPAVAASLGLEAAPLSFSPGSTSPP
ncbi:MAG: alanine dehydrogenase [Planctomycetota bacterium]|nr:MAG: alanine dehydrogenase [Planctomycetota bacterium]